MINRIGSTLFRPLCNLPLAKPLLPRAFFQPPAALYCKPRTWTRSMGNWPASVPFPLSSETADSVKAKASFTFPHESLPTNLCNNDDFEIHFPQGSIANNPTRFSRLLQFFSENKPNVTVVTASGRERIHLGRQGAIDRLIAQQPATSLVKIIY